MSSEKKPQPVAWKYWHKGEAFIEYDPIAAEELQYIGHTVEPLYSEATIEALRAERVDKADAWDANAASIRKWKDRAETAEARVAQLEAALEPFARPPVYVFDDERRYVPAPQPDGWEGGGWFSTEDFRRARALLSDGGR